MAPGRQLGTSTSLPDLLYHGGATRGFTAFIGFSPQAQCGLAALANTTISLRSHFIQGAYRVDSHDQEFRATCSSVTPLGEPQHYGRHLRRSVR